MTITLITTSGLSAGTAHTFASAGDELFVAQGVTWGSSNSLIASTSLNNVSATFAGDVIANSDGLTLSGDDVSVRIMATGSLTSYETGGGNAGVYLGGSDGNLINDGHLSSAQSIGVLSFGGNQIINRGTIDAASGVFIGLFGGAGDILINSGQISANSFSDTTRDARFNNGVIAEGADSVIVNLAGGIISATGSEGAGVRLHETANGSTVENHGEIVSLNYYGVSFGGLSAGNAGSLFNDGLITGAAGSFLGSAQADAVTNRGVMNGDVSLGGGTDMFDGRGGTVEGSVSGGLGDDTYFVSDDTLVLIEAAAEGTDTVKSTTGWTLGDNFENLTLIGDGNVRGIGNGENNTITGNIGDNRLRGKDGTDQMSGKDGDDRLYGGKGNDTLSGGDGDDFLSGGRNNDTLIGGGDDDTLRGGRNNDTLNGGEGNDVLIGGLGTDVMTGGNGKDDFVFNRKGDSLRGNSSDSITDFTIDQDRIDLSGMRPDLTFIGSGGFSGTQGEVQVRTTGGTDNIIKVDVDGDGSWDRKVVVQGVTTLSEADFIL